MAQPLKDAISICKTIMRNGFDAYIINAKLQDKILANFPETEIDICTNISPEHLRSLFPGVTEENDQLILASLQVGEIRYFFYPADAPPASHIDETLARATPRIIKRLEGMSAGSLGISFPYIPKAQDALDGFNDFQSGEVCFSGLPDLAIRRDYLRIIRALRFSANYGMPIDQNSWLAILRCAHHALEYIPLTDVVDEWRKVRVDRMHDFFRLLHESTVLYGFIPELALLAKLRHVKEDQSEESIFEHTLWVMKHYSEERPHDWYGVLGCLFHDIGKPTTAEFINEEVTFYEHSRVGAKITRKILARLSFMPEDIDIVCDLVRHHMRFNFMLNDRGIREFKALGDYQRLIEIARANIKAKDANYKEFNHNLKMLERTDISPEDLEPFLNGEQIMELVGLSPGPAVGLIRKALLKAQVSRDVLNAEQAAHWVKEYARKEKIVSD